MAKMKTIINFFTKSKHSSSERKTSESSSSPSSSSGSDQKELDRRELEQEELMHNFGQSQRQTDQAKALHLVSKSFADFWDTEPGVLGNLEDANFCDF